MARGRTTAGIPGRRKSAICRAAQASIHQYVALAGHLRHEEDEGLRLVDSVLTPQHWKAFSKDHRTRIGKDAVRYLPWLLDGASPETAEAFLGRMPEPLKHVYTTEWRTVYLDLHSWDPAVPDPRLRHTEAVTSVPEERKAPAASDPAPPHRAG